MFRRILAVFAAVALTFSGAPAFADVVGDDDHDQYIGSGAVLLPRSSASSDRATAAGCDECEWKLTKGCATATSSTCTSVTRGCPDGESLRRIWFRRDGGQWRDLGILCIGPSGVLKLAEAEDWVAEQFIQGLPVLRPAKQPTRGVLPRIPVLFRSRQPLISTRAYQLAGHDIRLSPVPKWWWRFGDGTSLHTDSPGARYPNATIGHSYLTAGSRSVRVRTTWSATFTVDGLGPFEVHQPITQNESLTVNVGQGRAVLIP